MGKLVYALPFIAIIGFIVGVILLIYAAVKKRPKKTSVIVIVVSILLGNIGALLSANQAVSDFSGGKMKTGDIVYMSSITTPINDMTTAINEYNAVIDQSDVKNPEWVKKHDETLAKLQESTKNLAEVKPGPNTKAMADEANLISGEVEKITDNSKSALETEDPGKLLELMQYLSNINTHLENMQTELNNLTSEMN